MSANKIKQSGGNINMKDGVSLEIPAKAVSKETRFVTKKIIYDDRVEIHLGPDGLEFAEPVKLSVAKSFLDNIEGVERALLTGRPGYVVAGKDTGTSLVYELAHFSIYYYRRR